MISIVIPTLNRGKDLQPLFKAIKETMIEAYEIIVVDDGSSPSMVGELKDIIMANTLGFSKGQVICLLLSENVGQQNATLAGIRHAKGEFVVTIDDDLQYNPKMILKLYKALDDGYDVVYGVPHTPENGHYRHLGTRFKEWVFLRFINKPKDIRLTSFRIMRKDIADFVASDDNKKVYISARLLQKTTNIGQVEIVYDKSQNPISRYNYRALIKLVWQLMLYYGDFFLIRAFKNCGCQYDIREMLICD